MNHPFHSWALEVIEVYRGRSVAGQGQRQNKHSKIMRRAPYSHLTHKHNLQKRKKKVARRGGRTHNLEIPSNRLNRTCNLRVSRSTD
jgi:hypothetical protein